MAGLDFYDVLLFILSIWPRFNNKQMLLICQIDKIKFVARYVGNKINVHSAWAHRLSK